MRVRILVVDDEPGILTGLRRVNGDRWGVTLDLVGAITPDEGLLKLDDKLDAVIIDMAFPGEPRGGLRIVREIKVRGLDVVMVVLSGSKLDDETQVWLYDHGVFPFCKPFDGFALLGGLVHAVSRTRAVDRESGERLAVKALDQIPGPLPDRLEIAKQAKVADALAKCGGNLTQAARELEVNRQWVQRNKRQK